MSNGVISIAPDASVREAAGLMVRHKISGLPVLDAAGTAWSPKETSCAAPHDPSWQEERVVKGRENREDVKVKVRGALWLADLRLRATAGSKQQGGKRNQRTAAATDVACRASGHSRTYRPTTAAAMPALPTMDLQRAAA